MMDCKKALVDNDGDVEAAMEFLRKKGLASAEKKSSRAAKEGIIETYIHTGAKLGIMVEVNCETDFVAKRPEFQELAKAIAMQIAASPTVEVVSEADISPEYIAKEKKIESGSEDLAGKPPEIVEKIVEGRIAKLVKTKVCFEPCPGHTHTTCTRMHTHTHARARLACCRHRAGCISSSRPSPRISGGVAPTQKGSRHGQLVLPRPCSLSSLVGVHGLGCDGPGCRLQAAREPFPRHLRLSSPPPTSPDLHSCPTALPALDPQLLMEQPYIRDPNMSVDELVKSYIAKLGENIKIARFVRFNLGDTNTDTDEE